MKIHIISIINKKIQKYRINFLQKFISNKTVNLLSIIRNVYLNYKNTCVSTNEYNNDTKDTYNCHYHNTEAIKFKFSNTQLTPK